MSLNYNSINEPLLKRIPENAQLVLDIGCDTGLLGEAIKIRNPDAYVVGLEMNTESAAEAKNRLDEVHILNIEKDNIKGKLSNCFDAIVFGDVLEHLYYPEKALRTAREMLSDNGKIYTCVPNMQHYSILQMLLRGDFQYRDVGLLDRTHIRFMTMASIMKLFLDAGMMPKKRGRLVNESNAVSAMLANCIKQLEYSELNEENLRTFQFLFEASPMLTKFDAELEQKSFNPLTFVICTNDRDVLNTNVRASPIFQPGHPHQIIIKDKAKSAAEGYNQGLQEAENAVVVFLRDDVYLPHNWDMMFQDQVNQVSQLGMPWTMGCLGALRASSGRAILNGAVIDRDTTLSSMSAARPSPVETLDDLLIAMPRDCGLRFDPQLGFHFFGADICLQNSARNGKNYVGYAPCFHNSQVTATHPPFGFHESKSVFEKKWSSTPALIDLCVKTGGSN